jgi:predicted ATPase/class 3 adenylate cyclase
VGPVTLPDLPTGTVTFVFAGVEASTNLHEVESEDVAGRMYGTAGEVFSRYGGRLLTTEGDSLFAVFETAGKAVEAAAGAQRALAELQFDGIDVSMRMGLHTGEARVVGNDYRGLDVHRAARVASAAHGGQVLVTEPTMALAGFSGGGSLTFVDLGEHHLKDLEQPERLFQLVAPELPAEFPPPRSLNARPTNLPTPQTAFVPRDRELGDIKKMVREHRMVTMTGPGGTGKTRLAVQASWDLRDDFEDGVFAVFLAGLADPELLPAAVAQALRVRQQGLTPIWETVKEYLAGKRMLLYLDNFEHLLPAASYVGELLAATGRLHVLVTSRAALRLAAEQEYPVPSMTLPGPDDLSSLDALSHSEAVALFVQRARLVNPAFELTEANAAAVAEICVKLDGLPLAIELAAARIRLLELHELARRLHDSLALLTGGARDLPARQQTLRNAIAWSYDLLDERERSLFRRVGVFAGGFTLDAMEALSGEDALDGLEQLVAQSLLKTEFGETATRYWALESVRQFADELLEKSAEAAEVHTAHAEFFASLAEGAQPELQGPKQLEWLQLLDHDNDNLRAAMSWSLASGRNDLAARLGWGLWMFWWLHGHQEEGRRAMEALLEKNLTEGERTIALDIAGAMALVQGDHQASIAFLKDAIALARKNSDYPRLAFGLHTLGLAALNGPDLETAQASFQEALPMFMAAGDDLMVSGLRTHLGTVALIQGDLDGAEASMTEGLRLARKVGDNVSTYFALYNLAQVALSRGDFETATPLLAEGLALAGEVQDQTNLAYYLEGWSIVLGARGEAERSARLMGASQHLREAAAVATYNYLTPSRPLYERTMAAVRDQMGSEQFDRAIAEGRAMSLQEAVAYALEPVRA